MKAGLTIEAKQRLGQHVDRVATSWEKRFRNEAKQQLKGDRKALLDILQKTPPMKAQIDWQTIGHDWKYYFDQAGTDRWREAFVPLVQGVITDQAEIWDPFFTSVTMGMEFDVVNIFAIQAFDDYMITFAQPIMETTNLDVVALLQTAMQEGWGIPQMQEAIGKLFERYLEAGVALTDEERQWFLDRIPAYRLENIVRSETIKASNFGNWQLFNGWGAPMKEWLAVLDARTRPDHLDAMMRYSEGGNPGPIPINEAFWVGGNRMMFPGDGPPEQVCNCRCTVLPFDQRWKKS